MRFHQYIRLILFFIIPFYFFTERFVPSVNAQRKDLSKRISLGIEIGNWQPHSLNDEPRFTSFGAAGATPFWGLNCNFPIKWEMGFHFSAGYWSLKDLGKIENVHSLVLHPVMIDFKHWLIPDSRFSAYVIYGAGIYWGVENETTPFGTKLRQARAGWGINLGAGFDFLIVGCWGTGMNFYYHYVTFQKPLGGVDDFSGPKITAVFFFLL